jgi:hypothetical protein
MASVWGAAFGAAWGGSWGAVKADEPFGGWFKSEAQMLWYAALKEEREAAIVAREVATEMPVAPTPASPGSFDYLGPMLTPLDYAKRGAMAIPGITQEDRDAIVAELVAIAMADEEAFALVMSEFMLQ